MNVPYSYLPRQFADIDPYLEDVRQLVVSGDFTLGKAVTEFENRFAALTGLPHAIGVASGTDALMLSLKLAGIGPGDEVITTPNTFIATVGAIVMTGATPVFVDNDEDYTIDCNLIEAAITAKTKAIVPVHLSGHPADMPAVMKIAQAYGLEVIEDAAQAILAKIDGVHVGSWGRAAAFSLHPLKNLNVWGDSGVIVTTDAQFAEKMRLFRNHGMADRDTITMFAHNSRLDSLQAVVGNRLIGQTEAITAARIAAAARYDAALAELGEFISIPPRKSNIQQVFHTYVIRVKKRDELLKHLLDTGVRAKIHYPVPVHLQPAAEYLGYKEGDFPVCEQDCKEILTLPVHQHLTDEEIDYAIDQIKAFYLG